MNCPSLPFFTRAFARIGLLTCGLSLAGGYVWAQTTSTIEGLVSDQQGLLITEADVELTSSEAAVDRHAKTAADGSFRIVGLSAGVYSVTVTKTGFISEKMNNVELTVNETLPLNIVLKVGSASENVLVASSTPLLDPTSAQTGATVTPQDIDNMPLNGRNYLDLLQLVPGVTVNHQIDPSLDSAVPILGERGGNAVFLLDGMPNRDELNGGAAAQFNQDSILEFQVITSSYKAEFGHGSGGIVNVVSKSGTNQWHGGGSVYHRNYKLDSSDIPGESSPPFLLRWDPSVQLGGPVLKDKAFFFGSIERIIETRELNFEFPPNTPGFIAANEQQFDKHSQTRDTRGRAKLDEQWGHHHFSEQMNLTNTHVTDYLPLQQATNLPSTRTNPSSRHLMTGVTDTATFGSQDNPFLANLYVQYRAEPSRLLPAHPQDGAAQVADNIYSTYGNTTLAGDLGEVTLGPGFSGLKVDQIYTSAGANLAKQVKNHAFKFGWDFQHAHIGGVESSGLFEQLFTTASDQQQYGISNSGPYILDVQGNADPNLLNIHLRNYYTGVFFQDDWKLSGRITLNLGIRWDHDSEFPNNKNFSPRVGGAWQVDSKTVLRASFGVFYDQFRFGIARDIPGFGGADVTRTRYFSFPRLFYGNPGYITEHFSAIFQSPCVAATQTQAQIAANGEVCPVTGPTGNTLPLWGVDTLNKLGKGIPAGAVVNQSNVQALSGLSPQQFADAASAAVNEPAGYFTYDPTGALALTALAVPGLTVPITVDPGFKTPYNRTYYLGAQRQLSRDSVVSIDYFYRNINNMLSVRNTNLAFEARMPGHTLELQPGTGNTIIQSFGPWLNGFYSGLTIAYKKQMTKYFNLSGFYTYTHARDDALNSSLVSNAQTQGGVHFLVSSFGPTDSFVGKVPVVTDSTSGKTNTSSGFISGDGIPNDGGNYVPKAGTFYNGPSLDRGPSDLALTSSFLVNGLIHLPWDTQFTGIFRSQTGFHYSRYFTGDGSDGDGDGLTNGIDWTPPGRNGFTAPPNTNLDIRAAKAFEFHERYTLNLYFEMFNLFNNGNPAAVQQLPMQPAPFGSIIQRLPGREGQVGLRFAF
jgi:Carboxypeptidase regulatory-like domain/TonB dependent receptor/TonB-dependent Receptor Plug Domain